MKLLISYMFLTGNGINYSVGHHYVEVSELSEAALVLVQSALKKKFKKQSPPILEGTNVIFTSITKLDA